MPYGLPGAVKLDRASHALDWDTGKPVILQAGAILSPRFPAADQDGFDGHWCCEVASTWQTVAVPGEDLPVVKR